MSFTRHGGLKCDAPDCRRMIAVSGADVGKLRKLAVDRGWSRDSGGGDRCPEHREPPAQRTAPGR